MGFHPSILRFESIKTLELTGVVGAKAVYLDRVVHRREHRAQVQRNHPCVQRSGRGQRIHGQLC